MRPRYLPRNYSSKPRQHALPGLAATLWERCQGLLVLFAFTCAFMFASHEDNKEDAAYCAAVYAHQIPDYHNSYAERCRVGQPH
jgi:hypothetical protein